MQFKLSFKGTVYEISSERSIKGVRCLIPNGTLYLCLIMDRWMMIMLFCFFNC